MTVYIDPLVDHGVMIGSAGPEWAHMTADTVEELHDFARALGLHRRYFQDRPRHPHYDLTEGMRAKAVRNGAKQLTTRDYVYTVRTLYGGEGQRQEPA